MVREGLNCCSSLLKLVKLQLAIVSNTLLQRNPCETAIIEDTGLEKRNRAQNDSKRGKFKVNNELAFFLHFFSY
jgi:hypothetical protein